MKIELMAGASLAAVILASAALDASQALAQGAAPAAPQTSAAASGIATTPSDDGAAPDKTWTGFAKLGYHLDPHWKLELQGGYRDRDPDSDQTLDPVGGNLSLGRALGQVGQCDGLWAAPACAQPDGSSQVYSYTGQLIFDATPDNRWFDPFVGVATRFAPNTNPQIQILGFGPGSTPFAYQAIAGIAFNPIGRVHIDITYRWTGSGGLSMRETTLPALASRYEDQTVALGLRYVFAAPPNPPAPIAYVPPPQVALTSTAGK